jgi:hypothetical protein
MLYSNCSGVNCTLFLLITFKLNPAIYLFKGLAAVPVQADVVEEAGIKLKSLLRRGARDALGQNADELLLGHFLQGVIFFLLISEGAKEALADVFAAGRAGAVAREDDHVVRQGHDFVSERVEEHAGQVLPGDVLRNGQVRAAFR